MPGDPPEAPSPARPDRLFEIDTDAWASRLIRGAVAIELALFVLNYLFNFYDIANDISIRRIFNIAREQSIPTFFASLQAVAVGLTAFALRSTTESTTWRRAWLFVGCFWCYVGVDDNAEIHERVGSALGRATEGSAVTDWWPSFSWQLFLAPILALGLLASVVVAWLATDRGRPLLVFCLGAMAAAQFIDVLEGVEDLFDDWAADLGVAPYTVGHGLRSVEEMLEMFATTAYWSVILGLLAVRIRGVRV